MSTTVIGSALADVRAQVWSARAQVARAGGATWAGAAAEAAEVRRADLLDVLRRCEEALDAADLLLTAVRRAEQWSGRAAAPAWRPGPAGSPWG